MQPKKIAGSFRLFFSYGVLMTLIKLWIKKTLNLFKPKVSENPKLHFIKKESDVTESIKFSSTESKAKMLIAEAERWEGVKEGPKDNSGQMVERFQKAVDGKAMGEPWCMSFVQFCIKAVDELCEKSAIPFMDKMTNLKATEHCMTLWNDTPPSQRSRLPKEGSLIIWQKYTKDGKPTSSGHVGIVKEVLSESLIRTIEGNTGSGKNVNRNGDGVYIRTRKLNQDTTMRVKGFVTVW